MGAFSLTQGNRFVDRLQGGPLPLRVAVEPLVGLGPSRTDELIPRRQGPLVYGAYLLLSLQRLKPSLPRLVLPKPVRLVDLPLRVELQESADLGLDDLQLPANRLGGR